MIDQLKNIIVWLATRRVLQHLMFWALSFLVLVNILRVSAEIKLIDVIYTLIFHLPIILVVYLNEAFLFSRFLVKQRYLQYVISVIILLTSGAFFYLYLFEHWIDLIFPGYYFIAYYTFWDILLFLSVYLVLTTLIKLARGWFKLNQMEQEKTSTELKALRSQLNPHFLFNSLNSIYSLSRKKSDLTPIAVLELSDVLRYVIYDAETEYISLRDELDFLNKYIKLQELRLEKSLRVSVNQTGEIHDHRIAPLLFLPFVENAFKYAPQSQLKTTFINIEWNISNSEIHFKIANSLGDSMLTENEKYKGLGIQNVMKRLELLYPNQYNLKINKQENQFVVDLTIQLK
ncbi:sensor histidine kinase [Sunxiuqinia sp. A32]|uniref:sensor histidine kinase n=1 Tax=Sunxiuqinia sp. A32 TaxID=3461496 RepID=UPI0040465C0F